MMPRRRSVDRNWLTGTCAISTILLLAAVSALAGCGSDAASPPAIGATSATTAAGGGEAEPDIPTVSLTATESGDHYMFAGTVTAPAGPVMVRVTNDGNLEHQAGIAKLKSGATFDQLEQTFQGPTPTFALANTDLYGGPNAVAPGTTGKAIMDLPLGDYVVYCFTAENGGKPHVSHGMYQELTVTDSTPTASPPRPDPVTTAGTITMKDFAVVLPDDFTAHGWYKVENDGPQAHEAAVYQLAPGKTAQDFMTFQSASDEAAAGTGPTPAVPRPVRPAGGAAAANPGMSQWIYLDLDPTQHYLFLCFVPDVTKRFEPHWMEGMMTAWPTGT
jgi:hypothetical protein